MVAATIVRPYGAIWNLSEFTGNTGKFVYSIFLKSRIVLGAKFSSAYITSTGASKYIKIEKNHHHPIFKNSPNFVLPLTTLDTIYPFVWRCLGLVDTSPDYGWILRILEHHNANTDS